MEAMSLDEQLESELPRFHRQQLPKLPLGSKRYLPVTLHLGLLYFLLLKSQGEKIKPVFINTQRSIPWMSLGCRQSRVPWQ